MAPHMSAQSEPARSSWRVRVVSDSSLALSSAHASSQAKQASIQSSRRCLSCWGGAGAGAGSGGTGIIMSCLCRFRASKAKSQGEVLCLDLLPIPTTRPSEGAFWYRLRVGTAIAGPKDDLFFGLTITP